MSAEEHRPEGFIARFVRHGVAAHLLMALMVLTGVFALGQVNTQFFPNFEPGRITVTVLWQGASAEDMEEGVTRPLEQELRNLDHLDSITSTSAEGVSQITLEYKEDTDMGEALEEAKSRVGQVRNLPEESEEPEITRITPFDPIASVLLYAKDGDAGPDGLAELRDLAQNMRDELLDRGIAKVEITGLPEQKVAIQVPPERLHEMGLSLQQVAERVEAQSQDLPAGEIGSAVAARQLRSESQRRRATDFEDIEVRAGADTGRIVLGDIARIELQDREGEVRLTHRGQPAVELALMRSQTGDTLESARVLRNWVAEVKPTLPPGVGLATYNEAWSLLQERIMLLVKNGAGGLLLVLAILFLFLRGRVAVWVALGIPVSFLAALAILYGLGGSVNMISLFALIMTLGIIVDDAIVVGEEALTRYQGDGEGPDEAAVNAARRMWPPVLSSSLTTIAAFLPLMLVGGTIGMILFDIPFVVICVIAASLLEAFLVLPSHLGTALRGMQREREGKGFRARFERGFNRFRDGPFRRTLERVVRYRGTTVVAGVALLIAAVGLLAGGRLPFSFFPSPEGNLIQANAKFVAGTPREDVDTFLAHLRQTLEATNRELKSHPVRIAVASHGTTVGQEAVGGQQTGDQFGAMLVELISPEQRAIQASDFIARWRENIRRPAGMESFTLTAPTGGPPGRDISIRLTDAEPRRLKAAARELAGALEGYPGLSAVEDDMPYGREQVIYRVNGEGRALGLSEEVVGGQLRAAYAGHLTQIFNRGQDEVEVRVTLPEAVQNDMGALQWLPIRLPNGGMVPLDSVVELETRRGFEAMRHAEAQLAVHVQADVDREVTNTNRVLDALKQEVLPGLEREYGISYEYVGQAEDQAETMADMQRGLLIAVVLIYLVLAAVFASYAWPLVVMAAIPFGLVGALVGHWLMGIDLTVLSLFGLFGLSGIVVNNSIILVSFFRDLVGEGMPVRRALVEASCRRLRAMVLTSLTTIAGLTPLLFEDSLQAQFLIPMAVSITFGLAFATVLVLVLVPALLSLQQDLAGARRGEGEA
ncbi:efflux RND transporter permease subunit [Thiohalorhabdus sp. Cl-TMA]|uniref:Efflux RND transporter permease subunit n=1 Tax=Thiohalorhabdus methylotrophus TaxID=3242694 RepID=A0ABV4TSF0_9GAMM